MTGPGTAFAVVHPRPAGARPRCPLAEFTAQRRAALRAVLGRGRGQGGLAPDADLDMLVDTAYGVLWYRLLVGHAPLDEAAARRLAARLIAAGAGGESER